MRQKLCKALLLRLKPVRPPPIFTALLAFTPPVPKNSSPYKNLCLNKISVAKPTISNARIAPTIPTTVIDHNGETQQVEIAGEHALGLYVDKHELITLMTLGQMPEALAAGWLLSQRLIRNVNELEEIQVDWEAGAVAVYTKNGIAPVLDERRTVTSGCGQGTMFSRLMEEIETVEFCRQPPFSAAALLHLLQLIRQQETIYKRAGAVHSCALVAHDGHHAELLCFVEDIGRHNAADAIAGWMQLNEISGDGKVFYTTGRLTSEMVIKCAQMRIPYLVSRSGTTAMGHQVANAVGLTMLGRAISQRYLIFSGAKHFNR
ncbi:MAG: formate dehydrogenase accessory sulfurtransferase FdhD [Proteobacteria bacterium]|nr:formate dehydrogenase accessory sulfurtransferase FdhD [Pseudomonadota bacterium]